MGISIFWMARMTMTENNDGVNDEYSNLLSIKAQQPV